MYLQSFASSALDRVDERCVIDAPIKISEQIFSGDIASSSTRQVVDNMFVWLFLCVCGAKSKKKRLVAVVVKQDLCPVGLGPG